MGKKQKNRVKTLSLRLPQSVAVALQKRAKAQKRSLNAQIVYEVEFNGFPKLGPENTGSIGGGVVVGIPAHPSTFTG